MNQLNLVKLGMVGGFLFSVVGLAAYQDCSCTYTTQYTMDDKPATVCLLSGKSPQRPAREVIAQTTIEDGRICNGSATGCLSVFPNAECTSWMNPR